MLLPDHPESSHNLSRVMLPYPMDFKTTFDNVTNASETNCSSDIDEFRYRVYPITYSIISILGFSGNSFVLWVLIRAYREKTAFQIFMLNLAVSDLLFVCTLPLRIVYYVYKGNWFFGDLLCRISSYTMYVNLYCSILFMTAMSFFRCVAIVFPLQNLTFITEKKAKLVSVAIWVFITLVSSPFLITGEKWDNKTSKMKCLEPPNNINKLLIMHYIALFIGFVLPFVTIVICCTLIIRTLLKRVMHRSQGARKKAIWMVIIVSATFLMSFTPYHVQRTIHIHTINSPRCEDTLYMQKSVVITLSLAAFNCCFDPLLYFFSGETFRYRLSTLRNNSILSGSRERPPATAM